MKCQHNLVMEDSQVRERVKNCSNPFGSGHAGEQVANLLASTPLDSKLLNKDLTY